MATSSPKAAAYRFLTNNQTAYISTVNADGTPHAAVINYLPNKDLSLYFLTGSETRKYRNLRLTKRAAIAIYQQQATMSTIMQMSGRVRFIDNLEMEQKILEQIWRRHGLRSPLPVLQGFEKGKTLELKLAHFVPFEATIGKFSHMTEQDNKQLYTHII